MKTLTLAAAAACLCGRLAAAEFVNLGFDEVLTNNLERFGTGAAIELVQGTGPVREVLQGWRLFFGERELTTVSYNVFPPDPGYAVVYSEDAIPISMMGLMKPEGKHALNIVGTPEGRGSYALTQTGDVPAWARVVQYVFSGTGMRVFANGAELPVVNGVELGYGGNRTLASFDIAAFAGKTVELKLATIDPAFGFAMHNLDGLEFVAARPPMLAVRAEGKDLVVSCALDTEWMVEGADSLAGPWKGVTVLKKGETAFRYPVEGALRYFRLRLNWEPLPTDD